MNKSYEIKCPDNEADNLQLAANKLNEQLANNKNKFKQLDEFQILLLAALNISHELVTSLQLQEEKQEKMNSFIRSLETRIDQAMHGNFIQEDPQTD